MSNPEHLAILQQGVVAWNKWRKDNLNIRPDLTSSDLTGVKLPATTITQADETYLLLNEEVIGLADRPGEGETTTFRRPTRADVPGMDVPGAIPMLANVTGANLTHADLARANLTHADLAGANLAGANLAAAVLAGANLEGANLAGAALADANLSEANLSNARLARANLTTADLTGADLRGSTGIRFDRNKASGAQLGPTAGDPWSVLRRKYTGPMLLFHLLLLVVFLVPYVGRAFVWSSVARGQESLIEAKGALDRALVELERDDATKATVETQLLREAVEKIQLTPCLSPRCQVYSVWQVLIGYDRGPWSWGLALALMVYNIFRLGLTYWVGLLRDDEDRSGYTPAWTWSGYRLASHTHRYFMQWFVLVAVAALLYHLSPWLTATVWLPATPR